MATCLRQFPPGRLEDDLARLAADEAAPDCLITDKAANLAQYLLGCKVGVCARCLTSLPCGPEAKLTDHSAR